MLRASRTSRLISARGKASLVSSATQCARARYGAGMIPTCSTQPGKIVPQP